MLRKKFFLLPISRQAAAAAPNGCLRSIRAANLNYVLMDSFAGSAISLGQVLESRAAFCRQYEAGGSSGCKRTGSSPLNCEKSAEAMAPRLFRKAAREGPGVCGAAKSAKAAECGKQNAGTLKRSGLPWKSRGRALRAPGSAQHPAGPERGSYGRALLDKLAWQSGSRLLPA